MFTLDETNKAKGLAVCLLVFHHMYRTIDEIQARGAQLLLLSPDRVSQLACCFRICVYMFVFLSAYGMTKKLHGGKEKNISFIIKRYIKLVMPYWFTLFLIWGFWALYETPAPFARYDYNGLYIAADFFSVLELIGHTDKMFLGLFWYMNFAVFEIVLLPIIYVIARKINWYVLVLTSMLYVLCPTIIY